MKPKLRSFRDKLLEKPGWSETKVSRLVISLPARKLHGEMRHDDRGGPSRTWVHCGTYRGVVYESKGEDETDLSMGMGLPRPRSTCKQCHDDYHSPLDIHSPDQAHCTQSSYPHRCHKCRKPIVADPEALDLPAVPCASFAWDWTSAVDRDSSFRWDFGFEPGHLKCLEPLFCSVLRSLIQEYLCLDVRRIGQTILDRGKVFRTFCFQRM